MIGHLHSYLVHSLVDATLADGTFSLHNSNISFGILATFYERFTVSAEHPHWGEQISWVPWANAFESVLLSLLSETLSNPRLLFQNGFKDHHAASGPPIHRAHLSAILAFWHTVFLLCIFGRGPQTSYWTHGLGQASLISLGLMCQALNPGLRRGSKTIDGRDRSRSPVRESRKPSS